MLNVKDVKGFEDLFAITEDGKLWSKRTNKFLKQNVSKTGYYTVATRIGGKNGKSICFKIHRLVAIAFIENQHDKPFVNHKDGNKLNNDVRNLEWCTPLENTTHAYVMGLITPLSGTDNGNSKLSEEQVQYIRNHYVPKCKINGSRALGRKFDIDHTKILRIINGESYKNIK